MLDIAPILKRIPAAIVVLAVVIYIGDYIVVRLRSEPTAAVQVTKLYAVQQKDGKTEYEAGDPETETCVNSLFPHLGYSPCWYLKRHKTQQLNL
jgi:hypothetical protein